MPEWKCCVCQGECVSSPNKDFTNVDFVCWDKCGHAAHKTCIYAWKNLQWKDRAVKWKEVPCPCCRKDVLAKTATNMSTAYIDPSCPYCVRLLAVISSDGVNPDPPEKLGFKAEIIEPGDRHVASHKFPHVWAVHKDLGIPEETTDDVVSMFTVMTGIPAEDDKVREYISSAVRVPPLTRAGGHVAHIATACGS